MILEACVENLEEAIDAQINGAHQIELCANLAQDGVTPSNELISEAKKHLDIPIHVMIRPRAGDFNYSIEEIAEMKASIEFCKKLKIEGVVFGILNSNQEINIELTAVLGKTAQPMQVTFHKAIDLTPDIFAAFETLKKIPTIQSVLTSGQAKTAMEGSETLKKLISNSGNIKIKVAGKVNQENLLALKELTCGEIFHGRKILAR